MSHEPKQRDHPSLHPALSKHPAAICPHVRKDALPFLSLYLRRLESLPEERAEICLFRQTAEDCRKEGGEIWAVLSTLLCLTLCQITAHPCLENVIGKKFGFLTP